MDKEGVRGHEEYHCQRCHSITIPTGQYHFTIILLLVGTVQLVVPISCTRYSVMSAGKPRRPKNSRGVQFISSTYQLM